MRPLYPRYSYRCADTGKAVTVRHDSVLTTAPDNRDGGRTTWITGPKGCVHVDASPDLVADQLEESDSEIRNWNLETED